MDPCNPNTSLNYARSQVKVNYNLNNVYAKRLKKRNICSIYTRCKNAKTLPPLKLSTYEGYVFLIDPRSPLIARDYAILLGRPKKVDVKRIAKKIKLVHIKNKTKKVLLVNIFGKLRKMKITEPIRLNTKVRVSRNFNNSGEPGFVNDPGLGNNLGTGFGNDPGTGLENDVGTGLENVPGLENAPGLGNDLGTGIGNSLDPGLGNTQTTPNVPRVGKLRPKLKFPIGPANSINLGRQQRIFNAELNMKKNQIRANAQRNELAVMKKRRANNMLKLNSIKKQKTNNGPKNNTGSSCPLIRGEKVCKKNQNEILLQLRKNLQEIRKKI